MTNSTLDIYWWNNKINFGDQLNKFIIEKISGKKINLVNENDNKIHYMCIGSILHFANKNTIVWGSGLISNDKKYLPKIDLVIVNLYPFQSTIQQQNCTLDLAIENIDIVHGDTDKGPFGMGTYGSRSLAVGGTAIVKACDKIIAKGRKVLFDVAEGDYIASFDSDIVIINPPLFLEVFF